MKDYIFYRKISRIIMQLAETLEISPERALVLFYSTKTCEMLHKPEMQLHIMSDTYIVNDIITELRG